MRCERRSELRLDVLNNFTPFPKKKEREILKYCAVFYMIIYLHLESCFFLLLNEIIQFIKICSNIARVNKN